ncbi:MAG TPA: hypothetical protein VK639_05755, partial [Terriglobales bacterium]|nr:hypothetical protein [Terriglobales bacterium]
DVVKFRVGTAVRQKINEMSTQGAVGIFFHNCLRVPPSDVSFVPSGLDLVAANPRLTPWAAFFRPPGSRISGQLPVGSESARG